MALAFEKIHTTRVEPRRQPFTALLSGAAHRSAVVAAFLFIAIVITVF